MGKKPFTHVVAEGTVTFQLHAEIAVPDEHYMNVTEFIDWIEEQVNLAIRTEAATRLDFQDIRMRFESR